MTIKLFFQRPIHTDSHSAFLSVELESSLHVYIRLWFQGYAVLQHVYRVSFSAGLRNKKSAKKLIPGAYFPLHLSSFHFSGWPLSDKTRKEINSIPCISPLPPNHCTSVQFPQLEYKWSCAPAFEDNPTLLVFYFEGCPPAEERGWVRGGQPEKQILDRFSSARNGLLLAIARLWPSWCLESGRNIMLIFSSFIEK